MARKKYTVIGHEYLTLRIERFGMFEVWCKVWEDGKRAPQKDGYFLKSVLKRKV